MYKFILLTLITLAPSKAFAAASCEFIQVQCLPSIQQMQLKRHYTTCIESRWYSADELARYEADNIYRPYEHHKDYERETMSYANQPEQPRNFICNMGENTIELELGITHPRKSSRDCQSSYGYLAYMKLKLNGAEVSEKIYFDNLSNCLEGLPDGKKVLYEVIVRAKDNATLQLNFLDGFLHKIYGTQEHIGTAKDPITYEDVHLDE